MKIHGLSLSDETVSSIIKACCCEKSAEEALTVLSDCTFSAAEGASSLSDDTILKLTEVCCSDIEVARIIRILNECTFNIQEGVEREPTEDPRHQLVADSMLSPSSKVALERAWRNSHGFYLWVKFRHRPACLMLGDLEDYGTSRLARLWGVGDITIEDIDNVLQQHGLVLRP